MRSGLQSVPTRLQRLRASARMATVLVGTALVAFHAWLLAAQVWDGRISDPWLVVRWFAAAGLVAALVAIRRRDGSIWSRKGVSIWVLAALLHGPALAGSTGVAFDTFALPEVVASSILKVAATAGFAAGVWLLAAFIAGRARRARRALDLHLVFAAAGILADGFSPPFSARPPPHTS